MSMYHPDIARMLVTAHQAELRRTVMRERAAQRILQKARRHRTRFKSRLGRITSLVSLRWNARRHRLAQRRHPGNWRTEVLAIIHPSQPCEHHDPCGKRS